MASFMEGGGDDRMLARSVPGVAAVMQAARGFISKRYATTECVEAGR
jgi:hypothetical protein